MNRDELYQELQNLENQRSDLDQKILIVKQKIEKVSPFSKAQKIALFHNLFIGNEYVYAKYWVSKDGTKKGYAPVTKTFRGNDYVSINAHAIQQHLEGKIRLGTYAVKNQNMCSFLAIDLDKSSFISDARAIKRVAEEMNITAYFEISKSGNGVHIWIFFSSDVLAKDARILGDLIITRGMDIGDGIDMKSYDRLFPNQDYVPLDALGNLIAIPLHYGSRIEGKTLFIDIDTMQPYADQWQLLQHVAKVTQQNLKFLIKDFAQACEESSLIPWENKKEKLIVPKSIKIVIHNALYIEKLGLYKVMLNALKRMASFYNPEFYIRQKQRLSTYNTPRIVSAYELNERYIILPRGLQLKLFTFLNKHHVKIDLDDKRFSKRVDKQKFILTLRPEQQSALKSVLKRENGVLIAPPGFGKTAIAAAVIANSSVSTLVLVHKTTLLEQWVKRLSEYFTVDEKSIGMLGKGKKRLNGTLDIATLQSLKNRAELIEGYVQVIIDESHHIPAVSFEVPLKRFRGKYILGLSATPKRKDGMEAIMYMQCGDILHEVKKQTTVRHILKTVPTNYETYIDHFGSILSEMVEDSDRNKLIVDEVAKLTTHKVLVLSERIEHLNILWHLLNEQNIKAVLLHGGLKTKEKKVQFDKTETASIILSTSSFIGEGVDIEHLDTIVFTMPISYPERIVQYLGRVGRQGQECLAIDFIDEHVPMLKSSFTKRMKGYKKMGYVVSAKNSLF